MYVPLGSPSSAPFGGTFPLEGGKQCVSSSMIRHGHMPVVFFAPKAYLLEGDGTAEP